MVNSGQELSNFTNMYLASYVVDIRKRSEMKATTETETVIFKSKQKKIEVNINLKLAS